MAEPDDFILTLLREIRREMKEGFADQGKQLESIRQALKTETIMGRYAIHDVDDRLDAIEKRLDAIEKRQ